MLLTIWAAVNRISRTGQEIGPEERISVWEALRAVTVEAAHQYGEEETKGQIREGMRADLVILSEDPLAVAPTTLRGISVEATYKDRVKVYGN